MNGRLPALVLAVLLGAVAAAAAWTVRVPPYTMDGTQWRVRRGPLVYRYDAAFQLESLFAVDDPREDRDLATRRPEDTLRMRRRFLALTGYSRLAEVPKVAEDHRRELERLGYIGPVDEAR